LLAVASLGFTLLFDRLGLMSTGTIDAIHFEADGEAIGLSLTGTQLFAVALINTWVSYALWAALYLAWKVVQARQRLQEQLRSARMVQLTHQLSPHFLFNAFNTIRGMVFEDQQRAADLITQLSELFRFHLQHEARAEHTLEDEWQLARRYLDIESTRLEARLRIEHDFDPQCLPQRLPSLSLLCLVENAIKHGIAPDTAGGTLRLSAQPTAAGWMLEVENSRSAQHSASGTGTGLANLRERLQLGFGEQATLEVEECDTRFRVRLALPMRARHAGSKRRDRTPKR
jgi:LytS/YehU family sensor histidine kinase